MKFTSYERLDTQKKEQFQRLKKESEREKKSATEGRKRIFVAWCDPPLCPILKVANTFSMLSMCYVAHTHTHYIYSHFLSSPQQRPKERGRGWRLQISWKIVLLPHFRHARTPDTTHRYNTILLHTVNKNLHHYTWCTFSLISQIVEYELHVNCGAHVSVCGWHNALYPKWALFNV